MHQVDVTVVIPTRNRPDMLARALDSIACQSHSNYEVYVVDDGSSEEHAASYSAMISLRDERFHLLQQSPTAGIGAGPSVSRNRGIAAGRGRYIAFLDDDDTWSYKYHLETAVEVLDRTGSELYCADMQGFSGDRLVLDTWFPDRKPLTSGERVGLDPPVYRATRAAFVVAASHRNLNPNPVVVSRQLVERAGGYLVTLRFAEDYEFLFRLADRTDGIIFCDKHVARYRLPEGDSHSLSFNTAEQHLQSLAAAQHLRVTAQSAEVRRAARLTEAWTLRLLSKGLRRDGRPGAALSFAVESVLVQPTFGGLLHIARTLLGRVG
jgi:glycosyltransferase involved in cell wall biosynthesis